jgi:hypothetical protein
LLVVVPTVKSPEIIELPFDWNPAELKVVIPSTEKFP